MVTQFVFAPVMPQLTVTRIDSDDEMSRVGELMRRVPDLFIGIRANFINRMRVRKDNAYIPAGVLGNEQVEVVFSRGDWLVESENGYRFITSDITVKHGVFKDFPYQLFIPIEGQKIEDVLR